VSCQPMPVDQSLLCRAHRCDDRVSVTLFYEVLDSARRRCAQFVTTDEMGGQFMLILPRSRGTGLVAIDAVGRRSHDFRIRCVSCTEGKMQRVRCSYSSSIGIGVRFCSVTSSLKGERICVDETPEVLPRNTQFLYKLLQVPKGRETRCGGR